MDQMLLDGVGGVATSNGLDVNSYHYGKHFILILVKIQGSF